MIIYVDVLVALNTLITYILLVAERVILKIPTNKWAIMFSSLIGGFASLVILCDDGGIVLSCIYKLLTGVLISGIGFLPKTLKAFLKAYLSFVGISFLFGGAIYALEITSHPKNIFFCNGNVYFDMSISYLVGCVLCVYGVFLLSDYLITKHSVKGGKCQLEITFNNNSVSLIALIDTGNTLTDGLSGRPVIVAEISAISSLFTREELLFLKGENFENVPESMNKKFRLIPCRVVTGDSLLKAFLPSEVKIRNGEKYYTTSFCTVALMEGSLSTGEYRALLNNNIFENGREEKKYDKIYT